MEVEYFCHHCESWGDHKRRDCPRIITESTLPKPRLVGGTDHEKEQPDAP